MKTRQQKEESVNKLIDKLKTTKEIILADYQGLTMKHLSNLRNTLANLGAEITIVKNTLLKLAIKKTQLNLPADLTQGPTAVLFAYQDQIAPLKSLVKTLKDAQLGKIKGGFLDNQFLDSASIIKLSTLPGKDELRAKVVSTLASPLVGMVQVLQASMANLVLVLNSIKTQRGGEQ